MRFTLNCSDGIKWVLGNDNPNSQAERESDGAEPGSPTSWDHQNHQNSLNKPNKEPQKIDPPSARSNAAKNKSMEKNDQLDNATTKKEGVKNDNIIKIESEAKSSQDSKIRNVHVDHVDSAEESVNKSQAVEKETEVDYVDSVSKTISTNGTSNRETEYQNSENHESLKAAPAVGEEVVNGTSNREAKSQNSENHDSAKAASAAVEEVVNVMVSDSVENAQASDLVESRLKGNEGSKRNEGKVSDEKAGESSTGVITNEDKMLPTSDAPISETSNGTENVRDSKIYESSENQVMLLVLTSGIII